MIPIEIGQIYKCFSCEKGCRERVTRITKDRVKYVPLQPKLRDSDCYAVDGYDNSETKKEYISMIEQKTLKLEPISILKYYKKVGRNDSR